MRLLRRNALRSALTTLGIIIGVGSLLAIAEIGTGAWSAIRTLLTKTGVDNIVVQAGAASRNGVSLGSGSIKTLTPEDAETIGHECPSVNSLSPLVFTRRQVLYGNKNWVPSTFVGTTPGYLRVREWEELEEGEPFTDRDVRDVAMVCLLGQTVARELFGEGSPVGREVYVSDVPLRVLGVLSRKGADIIGEDQDDLLVAPWTTVKFRISSAGTGGDDATGAGAPGIPSTRWSQDRRRYPGGHAATIPDPIPDPGPRPVPGCHRLSKRQLDPGPHSVNRRDPGRDGRDHPRAPPAAPDRHQRARTTSPSATSPRSSTPSRGRSASWPGCSCASP